jgi:hypothetical protein
MSPIQIGTRDGLCPACVFRPTAGAPWPAVLVYTGARCARSSVADAYLDVEHDLGKYSGTGYPVS